MPDDGCLYEEIFFQLRMAWMMFWGSGELRSPKTIRYCIGTPMHEEKYRESDDGKSYEKGVFN